MLMAAATYLSPALASSSRTSSICKKHCSLSISIISSHQQQQTKWIHQFGISKFSTWNGLRHHLGIPTSQYLVKLGRKGKCKGKGVYASLFGVGAPEALVIGVVALLVFGPKGLAEVARNVGKTLRTFQPTIRELQDVSREFKSTLEREIGLDEIKDLTRPTPARPPTAVSDPQKAVDQKESPSSSKPYTTEEYLKITEEQLKRQKEMESSSQSQVEPEGLSQDGSPSSSEGSLTEDFAKTSKQQKEASTESLVEPQDGSLAAKDAETQEYLKKLEEEVTAVIAEKQKKAATEIKSQVSDAQEAASVTPPSQKPESET